MTKNFTVYQISDTLLQEIKAAIKSVTHIDSSIKSGTVRKISARKRKRVRN